MSVETPLRDQALGKQVKAASGAGIRDVVFVGPAFTERGDVDVKHLAEGTQETLALENLVARYRSRHRGASDHP